MKGSVAAADQEHGRKGGKLGVRARLLLAFFAISGFSILATAAAIFSFREVGGRLEVIEARVPPALAALELSRSAERIIAAAPALLAATDRRRRDEIKAELAAEVEYLKGKLFELRNTGAQAAPLEKLGSVVSQLTVGLVALEDVVARRLDRSDRMISLRSGVFQVNEEVQRLLAPWLAVMEGEITALIQDIRVDHESGVSGAARRLEALIQLQQSTQAAQRQVSAAVDMLAEASTAEQVRRLSILKFQLGLELRALGDTLTSLDPKLRPLFLEQVTILREFVGGSNAITEARMDELALVSEGESLLAGTANLSAQLAAAVDELGGAAKTDIGHAIRDALSVQRLSARVLVGLVALSLLTSVLVVWLYVGRNIVRRLTALSDGMLAIAGGKLQTPVATQGRDEIAAMGNAVEIFRRNAIELEQLLQERHEAAARLEHMVEARTRELMKATHELEVANKYKSHFLASASHDLRQPLHALNLFVAQLRADPDSGERERLVRRIEAAVGSMNELFEALLDMSKLDAGVLEPVFSEFPVERLLTRVETTFAGAAREKGLHLTVVPTSAWVRSDFVLLERILFNLVSNAVRYTPRGGIVVGGRRRGEQLRLDVCDTGLGIPEDQQRNVFGEFCQLADSSRRGGLGLGLAIVDRLGRLLGHPVELSSRLGRGSRFSVWVPLTPAHHKTAEVIGAPAVADPVYGKFVLVIDDDPLVLDGMGGIMRSWGCKVLAADSDEAALSGITGQQQPPDLIIADYRLADGRTGIQAIERLRAALGAAVPAFLISGDTAPERLRDARENGFHLLHKPVAPMRLRAMLTQLLRSRQADASATAAD